MGLRISVRMGMIVGMGLSVGMGMSVRHERRLEDGVGIRVAWELA